MAGSAIELNYMPTSLILRAVDAPWTLPSGDLPSLPPSFSRRGLLQLVPREERFKMTLAKDVRGMGRYRTYGLYGCGSCIPALGVSAGFDRVLTVIAHSPTSRWCCGM